MTFTLEFESFAEMLKEEKFDSCIVDKSAAVEIILDHLFVFDAYLTIKSSAIINRGDDLTWDEIAFISILYYISVDEPFYHREWLYQLCSTSFRECENLFTKGVPPIIDVYHASRIQKTAPSKIKNIRDNNFISVSTEKGCLAFAECYAPNVNLYPVDKTKIKAYYCVSTIARDPNFNKFVKTFGFSLKSRIYSENEFIVIVDDETALLDN